MNDQFLNFIEAQFSFLGPITIKKMFGGASIYVAGVIFGIVADDVVYLKADASTQADYLAVGMGPFTYEGKKKPVSMSYYQLPEEVLEDVDALRSWAQKAVSVAQNSKKYPKKSLKEPRI